MSDIITLIVRVERPDPYPDGRQDGRYRDPESHAEQAVYSALNAAGVTCYGVRHDPWSESEYLATVDEYAHDVIEAVRERYADEYGSDPHDLLHETLDETIDGSQWVIYTAPARRLIGYSDHPDAYAEDIGEPAPNPHAAAYMAMRADVLDRIDWDALDAIGAGEE